MLNAGTMTWQQYWAREGYDAAEIREQQQAEQKDIQEKELQFGDPAKRSISEDEDPNNPGGGKPPGGGMPPKKPKPELAEAHSGQRIRAHRIRAGFDEDKHPRGQPDNAGQFGPAGGKEGESAVKSIDKVHDVYQSSAEWEDDYQGHTIDDPDGDAAIDWASYPKQMAHVEGKFSEFYESVADKFKEVGATEPEIDRLKKRVEIGLQKIKRAKPAVDKAAEKVATQKAISDKAESKLSKLEEDEPDAESEDHQKWEDELGDAEEEVSEEASKLDVLKESATEVVQKFNGVVYDAHQSVNSTLERIYSSILDRTDDVEAHSGQRIRAHRIRAGEFDESKHPRADDGKFGQGAGDSGGKEGEEAAAKTETKSEKSEKSGEVDRSEDAYNERQAARDQRESDLDEAQNGIEYNVDTTAIDTAFEFLQSSTLAESDFKSADELFADAKKSFEDHFKLDVFKAAGASDKELKSAQRLIETGLKNIDRGTVKLKSAAEKLQTVQQEIQAGQDEIDALEDPDEPEEPEAVEYPDEPDEPDSEPDKPEEPKRENFADDDDFESATEDYESELESYNEELATWKISVSDHEKAKAEWEEACKKVDEENESAKEEYEDDHDSWEEEVNANEKARDKWNDKTEPKLQEASEKALEKVSDEYDNLNETIEDSRSKVEDHLSKVYSSLIDGIREEEGADYFDDDEPDSARASRRSRIRAGFDETKHPRADDGKFGEGGGGERESGSAAAKQTQSILKVEGKGLSAEQKKTYSEAVGKVVAIIPDVGHERIQANLKSAQFYADRQSMIDGTFDAALESRPWYLKVGDKVFRSKKVAEIERQLWSLEHKELGGAFERGVIHLDGDAEGISHSEIYSHELGHAIDGSNHELSGSDEWKSAWSKEIVSGDGLTAYATVKPSEGFAEFCRAIYGGAIDAAKVEKRMPKCAAFFKSKGLWPENPTKILEKKEADEELGEPMAPMSFK